MIHSSNCIAYTKSWLIGKDPDSGKAKGEEKGRQKRRGQRRMSTLDRIIDSMDMNLSKLQEIVKNGEAWCAAIYGVTKNRTQRSD